MEEERGTTRFVKSNCTVPSAKHHVPVRKTPFEGTTRKYNEISSDPGWVPNMMCAVWAWSDGQKQIRTVLVFQAGKAYRGDPKLSQKN